MFFLYVVQVSVKGYNDKLHILLQKIVDKMCTYELEPQRFDILKEEVSEKRLTFPLPLF